MSITRELNQAVTQVVGILSSLPSGSASSDNRARHDILCLALDGEDVSPAELKAAAVRIAKDAKFYPSPSDLLDEIYRRRSKAYHAKDLRGIPVVDENGEERVRLVGKDEYDVWFEAQPEYETQTISNETKSQVSETLMLDSQMDKVDGRQNQ